MRKSILVSILFLFLISCTGVPAPEDKLDYNGRWESAVMSLTITATGRVEYKRVDNGKKSISAPIKTWDGNDFEVGVSFLTTKFIVQKPPYMRDGKLRMVVDGVELTKTVY